MRLNVRHATTYRFAPPMKGVRQSLRLWPSAFEGQTVIDWDVAIDGAERGAGFRDGAGDWIETSTVQGEVSEVVVQVTGTVETQNLNGVLSGHRERVNPLVYLRSTKATKADGALRDVAEGAAKGAETPLDTAHRLASAIREAITYIPGQTHEGTTAAEALALGKGVCQDHAHALIAAAHVLDMPARYVVGYLHAAGGAAEASHAWSEIWIPDLGWVGFDASNGVSPDENYIRIGSGFDSVDAAPIRGVAQGAGIEALDVDVNVQEQAQ